MLATLSHPEIFARWTRPAVSDHVVYVYSAAGVLIESLRVRAESPEQAVARVASTRPGLSVVGPGALS